ncbi:MAG: tetratricopeptide repeat protein [Myxococcales bacterium]|nr:tetratricopeptide repeat protein [Myxococcales bacterium]
MSDQQNAGGGKSSDGPIEVTVVEVEEMDDVSLEEHLHKETQLDRPVTVGELVDGASKALTTAGTTARRLVDQGRHRKVRISRNGKQILPDIPLAAFAAAEVASFASAGIARAIAGNVVGRFLFDVEVVNEADKYFNVGSERFLEGDFERAEQAYLKAVRIDDTHAAAYLQLGILYRMRGENEQARQVLIRALHLDDAGDIGRKAGDVLRAIDAE